MAKLTREELSEQRARSTAQAASLGLTTANPPPEALPSQGIQAPPAPSPFPALTLGPPGLPTARMGPHDILDAIGQTRDHRMIGFGLGMLNDSNLTPAGQKTRSQLLKLAEGSENFADVSATAPKFADKLRQEVVAPQEAAAGAPGTATEFPELALEFQQRGFSPRQAKEAMEVAAGRPLLAPGRDPDPFAGRRAGRDFFNDPVRQDDYRTAMNLPVSEEQTASIIKAFPEEAKELEDRGWDQEMIARHLGYQLTADVPGQLTPARLTQLQEAVRLGDPSDPRILSKIRLLRAHREEAEAPAKREAEIREAMERREAEIARTERETTAREGLEERGLARTQEGVIVRTEMRTEEEIEASRVAKKERVATAAADRKAKKAATVADRKAKAAAKLAAKAGQTPAGKAAAATALKEAKALAAKVTAKLGDIEIERSQRALDDAKTTVKEAKADVDSILKEDRAVQLKIKSAMATEAIKDTGPKGEAALAATDAEYKEMFLRRNEIRKRLKDAKAEHKATKRAVTDADDDLYVSQLEGVRAIAGGKAPVKKAAAGVDADFQDVLKQMEDTGVVANFNPTPEQREQLRIAAQKFAAKQGKK